MPRVPPLSEPDKPFALAVTTPRGFPAAPGLPTVAGVVFGLKWLVVGFWFSNVAPGVTTRGTLKSWPTGLHSAVNNEQVQQTLKA
jgi:hypothetical protein